MCILDFKRRNFQINRKYGFKGPHMTYEEWDELKMKRRNAQSAGAGLYYFYFHQNLG